MNLFLIRTSVDLFLGLLAAGYANAVIDFETHVHEEREAETGEGVRTRNSE